MQETGEETAPPSLGGPPPEPVLTSRDRLRGILCLAASAAVFPLTGMSTRRLRDSLPAVGIVFLWCSVSALALALAAAVGGFRIRPKYRRIFFLRGCTGALVTLLFFASVQRIHLGTATLLLFSSPVWVALFSALRGIEKPSLLEFAFVLLAVGGVGLTADPFFGNPGFGEGLALLAGIVGAGSAIFVREMRKRGETVPTVFFAFLLCGTVASAPLALAVGRIPSRADLPWIALFITAGGAGNFLMSYGFRFVRVTTCSIVQSSEAVFAAVWGWTVLGEVPTLRRAVGGVLLLGSLVGVTALRTLRR